MSVSLFQPSVFAQLLTTGGLNLNSGLIYTYIAGGTTPLATYTTIAGNVSNANPITLGADGRPPSEIWLTDGSSYRFDVKDSLGNLLKSYDNISASISSATLAGSGGSALIGYIYGGTGALARDLEDREQDWVSVLDFIPETLHAGIRAGSDTTNLTSYIQAAINLSAGRDIWFPAGLYNVGSSLTMPNRYGLVLRGEYQFTKLQATFAGGIFTSASGLTRQYLNIDGITFRASGTGAGAATGIAGNAGLAYVMFADITRCLFSATLRYGITGNVIVSEVNRCSFGTDAVATGTFKAMKLYATDSFQSVNRITNCEFNSSNDDYAVELQWGYAFVFRGNVFEQNTTSVGVIKATDIFGLRIERGWGEANGAIPFVKTFDGAHAGDMKVEFDGLHYEGAGAGANDVLLDNTNTAGKDFTLTNSWLVDVTKINLDTGNYDLRKNCILISNNKALGSTPSWIEGWKQYRGSWTANLTGCTATVTSAASYQRVGDVVTIEFATLAGTSNAVTKTITGLPADLRPTTAKASFPVYVSDNGGAVVVGLATLGTNGTITLYITPASGAWTNAGTAQVVGTSWTYTTN